MVTGAGSGIGAEIARELSQQGWRLTLLGRRIDPLETLSKALPADSLPLSCDVTQPEDVSAAFARAREQFGAVHALINCAGAAPSAPFHKISYDQWQATLGVNLNGVFLATQAALEDMRTAKSGRIINIASTASLKGYAYVSGYCAAKHAVLGMTRSLALELASIGITVNAICPGYTDTDIIRDAVAGIAQKTGRTEDEALTHFTDSNPQGRLITPLEVASAVQWLLSDGASGVNGQAIAINGGEI
ncbi:short-chain dehydrogenase/reductase SDR [Luminiphilus syltensis NOR5-1B]|uniref:Short-chain dehydrogenase/reductase SDR n=1 Tax=Luminiphilus syltensis NOR5-1B TaxID=565045 RepID=B8KTA1_9GAMM|nr:short-chain dehydrogenase/reductase SDR [Luminiphilus syltensis NOR5-1B]